MIRDCQQATFFFCKNSNGKTFVGERKLLLHQFDFYTSYTVTLLQPIRLTAINYHVNDVLHTLLQHPCY